MGRRGDGFGRFAAGLNPAGGFARLDRAQLPSSGFYPRKGRGAGQAGESAFPDLLAKWNKDQSWTGWRRGMELAFQELTFDSDRLQPVEVLRLPAFQPQAGFQSATGLLVAFPSPLSPEGQWTVAVKPRGTERSPVAIGANAQRDAVATTAGGERLNFLVVELPGALEGGVLEAGSALIGELVEDSADADGLVDEADEEALILMCVAVYPADSVLVFDADRRWRRRRNEAGRTVLVEEPLQARPRFRVGRHLTQSTVVSCNCPSHLGVEYGRLREDAQPGTQALFPQRLSGGGGATVLPERDAVDVFLRNAAPAGGGNDADGVARRFALLDWRREPGQCCKHCHAVRFGLGVPVAEPSDLPLVIGDSLSSARGIGPMEDVMGYLGSPRALERLERGMRISASYRQLGSTITTGAIGDAWGVTVEPVALQPSQVEGALGELPALRFSQQQLAADPTQAETALRGDVWAGRLTQGYSYAFDGHGRLLDQPFYLPAAALPPLKG